MAKSDFCFTYYDGDSASDTMHMNRLERGAYHDLILFQRKLKGSMTLDQIRKVLGRDFETCWPAMELILKKNEAGNYFIEWLSVSESKAKKHATHQSIKRKNFKNLTESEPNHNQTVTELQPNLTESEPLGDGDGDGLKNKKEYEVFETEFSDYERWTEDATTGNDPLFTNMLRHNHLKPNGQLVDLARSHLALLAKYPKMKPPDQHRFRVSLIDHIAKELKNGNSRTNQKPGSKSFSGKYEERL